MAIRQAAPLMLLTGSVESTPGDHQAEARTDLVGEGFVDLVRSSGGKACATGQRGEFAATFERGRDALACVVELRKSVDGDDAPITRWALDAVDVAVGDVADPSWRRVIRVLSLAAAGQVLLSQAAGEEVRSSLGSAVTLDDRGAPRPRDLGRPEHVLELVVAGRSDTTPSALRSLDGVPNNLPVQLTSFVGRSTELRALTALVADTHLLTLTGPGGCGKTRLALHLAAAVVDRYPDGVWIADLAPLADPALVPARVAEAIGVAQIPQQGIEETLTARLAPSVSLLVLDNCEHLTDACAALVERLLRACPRLTVVATSREPLGADGEMMWRVPSLSLPSSSAGSSEAAGEAVRLFVERAQYTRATFRLDDANRAAVTEICRRLDGIPLAIELAAARSRALSPTLIADQLKDSFALLTGGGAAALPRHRTLEASLEWSYSLLDDDQRSLFGRLAVFVGGFDLDAAEAVAAAVSGERWAMVDVLSALVDKSLVVLETDRGSGRFTLLESMRQFAMTKLISAGEVEVVRDRHADYYGAMAQRLAPELEGPGVIGALSDIDQDHDNLRSALDWRIQQCRTDEAMRMATALWLFWQRDRFHEGASRLTEALALPGGSPLNRALALVALGYLLFASADLAAMIERGEEALELADEAGDERALGRAKSVIAYGSLYGADTDPTEPLREALYLNRAVGDDYFQAVTLSALVFAGWMIGDRTLMQESLDELVSVTDANGNPQMRVWAFVYGAVAACAQGALDEATAHCAAATEITIALGDEVFGSIVLAISARIFGLRGQYDRAAAAAEEAIARSQAINSVLAVTLALWAEGLSFRDQGKAEAGAVLERARTLSEMLGVSPIFAELSMAKTRLAVAEGDTGGAADLATLLKERTARPRGAGIRRFAALADAEVALLNDDIERARAAADAALTGAVEFGDRVLAVNSLEFIAHLAVLTRRHLEAARLYSAASAERGRLGTPVPPADQAGREADLATLEKAMGADALAAAAAEGGAMTIAAAAGYAKRGRGSRRRSATGWSSLTPTEIEVAKLVADGLPNADVAARLFITVATVKSHLSRVFRKLDVANRAELRKVADTRT